MDLASPKVMVSGTFRSDPARQLLQVSHEQLSRESLDLLLSFLRGERVVADYVTNVQSLSRHGLVCLGIVTQRPLPKTHLNELLSAAKVLFQGELADPKTLVHLGLPACWAVFVGTDKRPPLPVFLGTEAELEKSAAFAHEQSRRGVWRETYAAQECGVPGLDPPEAHSCLQRHISPNGAVSSDMALAATLRLRGMGFVPDCAASGRAFSNALPVELLGSTSSGEATDIIAAVHLCLAIGRRTQEMRRVVADNALALLGRAVLPAPTHALLHSLICAESQATTLSWLLTLAYPAPIAPGLLPCENRLEILRFTTPKALHVRVFLPALGRFLTVDYAPREAAVVPPSEHGRREADLQEVLALLPHLKESVRAPAGRGEAAGWTLLLRSKFPRSELSGHLEAFVRRKTTASGVSRFFLEGLAYSLRILRDPRGDQARSLVATFLSRHDLQTPLPFLSNPPLEIKDPVALGRSLFCSEDSFRMGNAFLALLLSQKLYADARHLVLKACEVAELRENIKFRDNAAQAFLLDTVRPTEDAFAETSDRGLAVQLYRAPSYIARMGAAYLIAHWRYLLERQRFFEAEAWFAALDVPENTFYLADILGKFLRQCDVEKNAPVFVAIKNAFEKGNHYPSVAVQLTDAMAIPFLEGGQAFPARQDLISRWASLLRLRQRFVPLGSAAPHHHALSHLLTTQSNTADWLPTGLTLMREAKKTKPPGAIAAVSEPYWRAFLDAPSLTLGQQVSRAEEIMRRLGFVDGGPLPSLVEDEDTASAFCRAMTLCLCYRLKSPNYSLTKKGELIIWAIGHLSRSNECSIFVTQLINGADIEKAHWTATVAIGTLLDLAHEASLKGEGDSTLRLIATALVFISGNYWKIDPERTGALLVRMSSVMLSASADDKKDFLARLEVLAAKMRAQSSETEPGKTTRLLRKTLDRLAGASYAPSRARSTQSLTSLMLHAAWGRELALYCGAGGVGDDKNHWAQLVCLDQSEEYRLPVLREILRTIVIQDERGTNSLSSTLRSHDLQVGARLNLLLLIFEVQSQLKIYRIPLLVDAACALALLLESTPAPEPALVMCDELIKILARLRCLPEEVERIRRAAVLIAPCLEEARPEDDLLRRLTDAMESLALRA